MAASAGNSKRIGVVVKKDYAIVILAQFRLPGGRVHSSYPPAEQVQLRIISAI